MRWAAVAFWAVSLATEADGSRAAAHAPGDLAYTLTLVRAPALAVEISLEVTGTPEGMTVLGLENGWGGVEDGEQAIRDLSATSGDGRPLRVERRQGGGWEVRHAPGERFYARRLLLRAGVLSLDAYVADLNERVKGYLLTPARNATSGRIRADYWTSPEVQRLPYLRGDLVALAVDSEMGRVSGGRRTLDDLMRELVAEARRGTRIDTEALLDAIERHTSSAFAGRIRRVVVDGETLTVSADLIAPCLVGEQKAVPTFDLGFDLEASGRTRRIQGLRKGSAAHAAGLRDGQALLGWSVQPGQPDRPAELKIRDGGRERYVRYLPRGRAARVLQFALRDGDACSRKL